MTLTTALILIAIILILLDLAVALDYLTQAAYVLLAVTAACNLPAHWLYQIIAGILVWFAFLAGHSLLWRRVLENLHERGTPQLHTGGLDAKRGRSALIKEVEGRLFAFIDDEILPFQPLEGQSFQAGDTAVVKDVRSGQLILSK